MPRKKQDKRFAGDPNDPEGLYVWATRHVVALRVLNFAPRTIQGRRFSIERFLSWCETRSLRRPVEITKPILERYQRHVFYERGKGGRPLSFRVQYYRLQPVREFFRWLTKQNVLLANPASELELPRIGKPRLPKHVLTAHEAEQVLTLPNVNDAFGLRDRAILETLYSTGLRRMEIANLSIYDLDTERGTMTVRWGKGGKDRVVPIGERAALWIERYRHDARPELVVAPDEGVLFLTRMGEKLSSTFLSKMVTEYVSRAGIDKRGSCHLFRHTMATVMLEGGADIRYIQAMLGHSHLSSTQVYTRVGIRRLCEVHRTTHPGATWPGVKKAAPRDDGHAGETEEIVTSVD